MGDGTEFIDTIGQSEYKVMQRLFAADENWLDQNNKLHVFEATTEMLLQVTHNFLFDGAF